ncbi:substrate-binding domain-containing protein [Hyphomicrobium sp.]|jgi:molybdate transport repressor ModE-like protein|uniref:substrate-binding domain-containing protein n=1 Tax=Hyphomicrobium sp. TaxID=82 RepID=UPI002FE2304F
MIEIEIEAIWRFRRREDAQSLQIMLDVLAEIRASGKITAAAEKAHVSYRHAWNMIEKWSEFFDTPLVVRRQGAGTRLTPFGERLVWAGERLEARLRPLLQNLSQELETEINQMLPHGPLVLRVHASHGFAVPKLRELLSREQDISVDLRYVSNQNSLVSLAHDGCDLAGMHLPQGELRKRAIAASRGWLNPNVHRVISLVTREMGLMVQRGNPLGILELKRLLDPAVRFVNRDSDSGTRLLFEQLLTQHGISGAAINGYEHTEFTHAAVAAYVASGLADVAFGVESAARQFGLDFVRLLTEDYFFVCRSHILETAAVQRVLSVMRSEEFHSAISQLPGYHVKDAGAIKTISQVFRRSI